MPRIPKVFYSKKFRALPPKKRFSLRREWNLQYKSLLPKVNSLISEHEYFRLKEIGKNPKEDLKKMQAFLRHSFYLYRKIGEIENAIKQYLPKDLNFRRPPIRIHGPLHLELKFHELLSNLKELNFVIQKEKKWANRAIWLEKQN